MFHAQQSVDGIACIPTSRETVLIGPPGAFGVAHRNVAVSGRGDIGSLLTRIFTFPELTGIIRKHARQWGMEPTALRRLSDTELRSWLGGQVERGALCVALVPDPAIARAPYITGQEQAMEQALMLQDQVFADDDEILPPDLESRFLIAFDMLPPLLSADIKKRLEDLIDLVGLKDLAVGFLLWLGPNHVPGLHLVVFAANRQAASGEILHALDTVRECIKRLQKVSKRSEIEDIAPTLAEAVKVLSANEALSRLLRARTIARGQSSSSAGGLRKSG